MIGALKYLQCHALAELLAQSPDFLERRQLVASALQKQHRDLHLEQMLSALLRRMTSGVQRKSNKHQSTDARERRAGLRL